MSVISVCTQADVTDHKEVLEIPSGLLPSDLATPEGSKRAGNVAADRALWMMSFN